jgi:hypothetical protein
MRTVRSTRIQVVGQNGSEIIEGGVEVPEEVSYGQFPCLSLNVG